GLAECSSLLSQDSDDRVSVAADTHDFADRRLMREQAFLDHLADGNYVARKIDIFVVQVSSVAESAGVRSEKAAVGADNEETRRRFHAVVNRLAFHFVTETLQANLARISFHQLLVMQPLLVSDVAAVLIFFLHVATRGHVRRV